jgi:TolB protein
MFRRFMYFSLLLVSMMTGAAHAALNLELTQGIDAALPITVHAFDNDSADLAGHESLTQVIRHDLENSGQFHVKTQGTDDQLMGKITSIGAQRYRVSFRLVSAISDGQATDEKEAVLLLKSFDVTQAGLRLIAHHISDLVFEKLTGIRGVFSTKVAYVLVQRRRHQATQYSLEVADVDGFNPHALLVSTQPIMSPAWSPNGKQLAYVSFEGHRARIYLQNIATGQRQVVGNYPGINGAPAFSPDGHTLAFVLTLTGNPKIYTYDLHTKKLTRITNGYAIDTEPSWSPDGKSLLFTSNRGGNPQIYRYDFATHEIERLSFEGNYNARASYLPNAEGIVMMHRGAGMFGIAYENLASGKVQVLVQTGADESPSVAPNGKMIIYATEYGGRGVLALVSLDGHIKLRLPAREGIVRSPTWSPFLS